ncbi:UNVERIFIED_CONTAM: hypothetical protein GTU68_045520 [Idotea baltica]|nr:hypothetical protein [Idotea baltica]
MFENDPNAFKIYHAGFNTQVEQWPVNPVDVIVSWLKKKPKNWVVADFGCGEAVLAKSINQHKVHSFDLVSSDPLVTQCDMAHTPLEAESVNVAVFCLSLMGTNLKDYILEANRILEYRGVLKVAEVESRFSNNGIDFLKVMLKLGFKVINKDQTHKYFWLFDFLKIKNVTLKESTPEINLKPCIYRKR